MLFVTSLQHQSALTNTKMDKSKDGDNASSSHNNTVKLRFQNTFGAGEKFYN